MATFVLVHGSTQGPAGWERLVTELAALGHASVCVDLPVDRPDASATAYARVIADAVPDPRAIIVAHSTGGIFAPLVPALRPIARIALVAAMLPQPGTSVVERIRADSTILNPAWIGKDPTRDDASAREFLFHDCAPDVLAWAMTTRRLLLARAAMTEVTPLAAWPTVPTTSIVCADDRTIQPVWSRRVARELLGVEPLELPGGHCPHVARPAALARLLANLA